MMMEDDEGAPAEIRISAEVCGRKVTIFKRNLAVFDGQDPYFFDSDYTIAGSTGFLLWEANWLLIELINEKLQASLAGKKILDLGSGTGLSGLAAAAAGGHVLLTDLPSVLKGMLTKNVLYNKTDGEVAEDAWKGAVPIFQGSATTCPLDWTEPLDSQITLNDPRSAECIIAVDTIWLKDIFLSFVDLVLEVLTFKGPNSCDCYLAFVERAEENSTLFVRRKTVISTFIERGCDVETLLEREVLIDSEPRIGMVLCITWRG